MTDEADFLRAILERPGDAVPRSVFADWLEEHSRYADATFQRILVEPDRDDLRLRWADAVEGESPARAEFVRVQVELAKLPPAHVEVTERCVLERRYGPDYYALTGGEGTQDGPVIMRVKVGDRVDVLRPRSNKGKPMYGLRVHRITDDEVILVNDAKSGPWAGQALRRRERELVLLGAVRDQLAPLRLALRGVDVDDMGRDVYDRVTSAVGAHSHFRRGFFSVFDISWADFSRHAAALLAACPIRRVNRPRRCEECRGFGFYGQNDCLYCRGTGTLDDWRGDGLVRLTTWPAGRSGEIVGREFCLTWLGNEYPGVTFELPAAGGITADFSTLAAEETDDGPHLGPGVAFRAGLVHADPAIFQVTPEARP